MPKRKVVIAIVVPLALAAFTVAAAVVYVAAATARRDRYSPTLVSDPPPLITRTGNYALPDGRCSLAIKIVNDLVVLAVVNTDGASEKLHDRASVFSRWHVAFDDRGCIWYYNGDLGHFVFKRDEHGRFRESDIEDADVQAMPEAFYQALNRSAKAAYQSRRH